MSDKDQSKEDRRAAALRDNLKKRKAFVKGTKAKAAKEISSNKKDE